MHGWVDGWMFLRVGVHRHRALTQVFLLCPLHFSSVVEINFPNERKLLLMSSHLSDNKTSWPLFPAFEKHR